MRTTPSGGRPFLLGLMALDYTAPVRVITDSFYVIRQLENRLRRQDAAARS